MGRGPSVNAQDDQKGRLGRLMGRSKPVSQTTDGDTDQVTGLATRDSLDDWLRAAVARSKTSSSRCAVTFITVSDLQDVNDSYGPGAGDLLLRSVGARLQSVDLSNTKVMRYGGAEFAMIFERLPNPESMTEVCRYLLELLHPPFDLGAEQLTVAFNLGAALNADNYDDVDAMIRDAHEALVQARREGPRAWQVHDESRRALHSTRIDEGRLHKALENDEFVLYYQPIVRVDNRQMIGVEALLRWRAPGATNVGLLYPHDFMPLLEKTGMAEKVGDWVVTEACRQASQWRYEFPSHRPLFVTVNIGARQLASAEFSTTVKRALDIPGVEPWQLCLDLTEEALRYNRHTTWSALRELKNLGVKLGLDDFGTGVASFSYLREIALDLVRVDRVFVGGMLHSREDRAIIKHMVGLAHDLELVAVAEGVEDEDQQSELDKLGVDLAQGYLYGRPESVDQIGDRLRPEGEQKASEWATSNVLDFES